MDIASVADSAAAAGPADSTAAAGLAGSTAAAGPADSTAAAGPAAGPEPGAEPGVKADAPEEPKALVRKEEWPQDLPEASRKVLEDKKELLCEDCRTLGNVWRDWRKTVVAVFCDECCNAIASHADAHCGARAKHLVDKMGNCTSSARL